MAAPRWTALAASAVIALMAFGIAADRLVPASSDRATVASAVAATIIRSGHAAALTAGTEIGPGDTVVVGPAGSAVVRLDVGEARLAPGAALRIDELRGGGAVLEQLAGRVYHRVAPTAEGGYVVATGSVTWTAAGTAFDLDREPVSDSTLERVTGTVIERSVLLNGPSLAGTLVEGRQATVMLGTETPAVATQEVPAAWYADPWVAGNTRLDLAEAGGGSAVGRAAEGDALSDR